MGKGVPGLFAFGHIAVDFVELLLPHAFHARGFYPLRVYPFLYLLKDFGLGRWLGNGYHSHTLGMSLMEHWNWVGCLRDLDLSVVRLDLGDSVQELAFLLLVGWAWRNLGEWGNNSLWFYLWFYLRFYLWLGLNLYLWLNWFWLKLLLGDWLWLLFWYWNKYWSGFRWIDGGRRRRRSDDCLEHFNPICQLHDFR